MSEVRGNSYPEILHALDHEHTRHNLERHVQVLGRWSDSCANGIFIKDLEHVTAILCLLHDRLENDLQLFEEVALDILRTCAKPLLECKANERLRQSPMVHTKSYYSAVLAFLSSCSVLVQIECAKTIRVIANGGVDHSILKSDVVPWRSADGASVQVTDTHYIRSLLRECDGINVIVSKFCRAVNQLGIVQSNYASTQSPARTLTQDEDEGGASPQSPSRRDSDSESESGEKIASADCVDVTGTDVSELKKRMYDCRKLSEGLLYVCLDLSTQKTIASLMCMDRISDAAILLIEITNNPRDIWTSKCVELLWNCLEAYFDEKEANEANAGEAESFVSPEEVSRHDTAVITFDVALGVLRGLFLTLLFDGYRNADKELRNEIVIVLTLIAKDTRSVPYFIQTGMLTDLVTYSCAAEAGVDGWFYASRPMAKLRNFASVFDVDLQLKREMWLLLSDLINSDDSSVLLCVASSPFLRVLCKYLEYDTLGSEQSTNKIDDNAEPQTQDDVGSPNAFTDGYPLNAPSVSTASLPTRNYSADDVYAEASEELDVSDEFLKTELLPNTVCFTAQSRDQISESFLASVPTALMCELQVLAANVLGSCAHRMMAEFLRISGPAIALLAVDKYTDSTMPEHKSFVNGCLLVLNKCVTYSVTGKRKLEDLFAIKYLLRLFEASDDDSTKCQVLRLFSIMAVGSSVAQIQIRECDGIPALVRELMKFPQANKPVVGQTSGINCPGLQKIHSTPDAAAEEVSSLMVALLDAIWMAVVGNTRNESIFAECEGTDALLEALECTSFLLRGMALRVVSDLLMNRRLLAFVESWRSSRSMRSVNQLLAHAWMDEEVRLGFARDAGVLCNMWNPLDAHNWPDDPRLQESENLAQLAPPSRAGVTDSLMAGSVNTDNTSSVWFPPGATASPEGMDSPPKTSIVEKLANAVTMSRKETAGARVSLDVRMQAASKDMRGVIASIFTALGLLDGDIVYDSQGIVDNASGTGQYAHGDDAASISSSTVGDGQHVGVLSPSDKQVLCVAKRYDTLREGEWWKAVFDDLRRVGVNPIEEDLRLIELKLDAAFEATQASQFEQMELQALDKRLKVKSEDAFMGQILRQKHQQIKSEWLKRNAHREKTNKNKISAAVS